MIEDAIKSLGNELHIPIEKARVWRLDFGANFRMKYSPELYLTKLGYLDNFHRSHLYPTSLYYNKRTKNADRQLIFYDKTSELKSKNRTITKDISSNLLRYEFKLLKNAPRQLKRKVRVTDLYDPLFYKGMLDLWYKTYEEIEKHRDNPPRLNFTRGKKFFYISAIQYCCNVENISDFIDELSMKREINAKQKYELKKIVKNALKEENYSAEDDSKIDELTVYVLEEYLKQLKMLKKFENRKVV